jgi:serine/threonine protein kinase
MHRVYGLILVLTMDELLNKDNPEEIYTDQRVIGAGSYGQVYYARDKFKARDVAIKKMQGNNDPFGVHVH